MTSSSCVKMKLSTIITILLVNFNLYVEKCDSSHTSMCLGLPVEVSSASDPPQTLGLEKLFPQEENVWKYFKTPIENYKSAAEIAPLRPKVSLYGLKVQNAGGPPRFLNGWLKISVELKGSLGFVLCAHDGNKMPVGQFTDDPFGDTCGPILPNVKYNILPCGGVPAYEPYVPSCIVYIHQTLGNWNHSSPVYNDNPLMQYSVLTFYWHFSQQTCNLKEMIHFKGYFIQERDRDVANYHPFFQDIYVSSDAIFGAADPPPKPSDVIECNTKVSVNNPPWVSRIEGDSETWTWVYGHPFNDFEENTGCQANYFGGRCVNVISSHRGSMTVKETPRADNLPKCQTKIVTSRTLTNYDDYIDQLVRKCTCDITTPQTPILSTTKNHNVVVPTTPGTDDSITTAGVAPSENAEALSCDSDLGRIIWALRQSHAVCMIIVTMFLSPLSIFISRYFKESFMNFRIVYLQVWYFGHIHITILSVVIVAVGMISVLISNSYMGRSLTYPAYLHHIGGWITIALLLLISIFGGCRSPNLLSVCTHWFFGICVYLFSYLLIWNSVYIHGSPIADFDMSIPNTQDGEFNMACGYLIAWIVIDFTIHIIMTLVLHATDSSMSITSGRLSVPPPIPVIHKDSKIDVPGTGFRTMCFFIHGAISLFITVFLVILVLKNHPTGKSFGPHFCTHNDEMSNVMKIQKNCWSPPTDHKYVGRVPDGIFNPRYADYYEHLRDNGPL